jgi:hypothetical protein
MRFVHIFGIAMYPYNYNPVRDHCNGAVHDERRRFIGPLHPVGQSAVYFRMLSIGKGLQG